MYVPPCFSTKEFTMNRLASPISPNIESTPAAESSSAIASCTNIGLTPESGRTIGSPDMSNNLSGPQRAAIDHYLPWAAPGAADRESGDHIAVETAGNHDVIRGALWDLR